MFRALVLRRDDGTVKPAVEELREDDLPEAGDTVVTVLYSSLNYKDALAVTGRGKIIRGDYPFVPGIDLVGRIRSTGSSQFSSGELVIGTGWELGESHWGGFSGIQRVASDWLVPLPDSLSPLHAMTAGTAGLTAMLSVLSLREHGVGPDNGKVLVTGASGGVGSLCVALLARSGYHVVASTGNAEARTYLERLGAAEIIGRGDVVESGSPPLASARWSGAVDVVGGSTLAAIIASLSTHGAVAVCGLAGSPELNTTTYPFILRGVSMLGIDSNTCPMERRLLAWRSIADQLPADVLDSMTTIVRLRDVPEYARRLLGGANRGRIVVDVGA